MDRQLKIYGKRLLRYFVFGIVTLLFEIILSSVDGLEFWNKDIMLIKINGCLIGVAVFIAISICYVIKQHSISPLHIWIKRHRECLVVASILLEVLFLYKCNSLLKIIICMIEFVIVLLLIDCETTKIYKYNFVEISNQQHNYVEKPVIGRSNLTKNQCIALDQLKTLIDKRSSFDSFNIALIGSWGCGKTSITDTLIYEYEKENNKYFLLKMSTLTLSESKNVVTYVKNYFEDLFRKYEIGIAKRNVAFLTTLANSFSMKLSFPDLLSNINGDYFLDIEKEKELFSKQVSKLLRVSAKKNVILLIDDTDRSEDEEQIIKVLSEFASIPGIISIVSLDKSKDKLIRPNKIEEDGECVYNQMDKYIHVRIRISEDKHIEYDKNITKQILSSFENIVPSANCFISCDGENIKNSLFDSLKDYQTTEVKSSRYYSISKYNILTTLFLYNLKYNEKEFGNYFEGLVNEYLYNSKELLPYIKQMLTTHPNEWNTELYMINTQWTNSFGADDFDWLMRLSSNSGTIFWTLCQIAEAIELINDKRNIKDSVTNIEDVYDYFMIEKFPLDGRTWENRKENPVTYSGFEQIELIVFGTEQYRYLNKEIAKGNFEEVKIIIEKKIKDVANLYFSSIILGDFMEYLRTILNNFRTFKMQLREAELLNINYLDYLIQEWQPRKNVTEMLDKMKEQNPILNNKNIGVPSLSAFINNILFENYILKFGNRFNNQELKDCRLFLYNGQDKQFIVIAKKKEECNNYIILDISGNEIKEISKDTMDDITNLYSAVLMD